MKSNHILHMIFRGHRIYRNFRNFTQKFGEKYENEKFWKEFGINYYDKYKNKKDWIEKQEFELLRFLKTKEFNSVLEFGCGFGRVTKVLCENFNIQKYLAFDISPHQIENAKKYCEGMNVLFQVSSIKEFESNDKFDLVIGPEILMHIEPKGIDFVMQKMENYSKRYFMWTGSIFDPDAKIYRATHTFSHNYKEICEKLETPNLTIIPVATTPNRIYVNTL